MSDRNYETRFRSQIVTDASEACHAGRVHIGQNEYF